MNWRQIIKQKRKTKLHKKDTIEIAENSSKNAFICTLLPTNFALFFSFHPTSHANRTKCFEQLHMFKAVALNSIFPLLREVAKRGTKILWLASEDMSPKHEFTPDQVDALREHNAFLEENLNQFSPDLRFMSFLGVNRKTVYTPGGNLLLGDGTHKLQRVIKL